MKFECSHFSSLKLVLELSFLQIKVLILMLLFLILQLEFFQMHQDCLCCPSHLNTTHIIIMTHCEGHQRSSVILTESQSAFPESLTAQKSDQSCAVGRTGGIIIARLSLIQIHLSNLKVNH